MKPIAQDGGHHGRGDYEVKRDQEVGGVSAGVERHSEGQREDDGQGDEDWPAAEDVGQGANGYCCDRQEGDDPSLVVAEIDYLGGVPLVAGDQDREQGHGEDHRGAAWAARGQQDRGGAGRGGGPQPRYRQEVA
jgi:hypothetical protein